MNRIKLNRVIIRYRPWKCRICGDLHKKIKTTLGMMRQFCPLLLSVKVPNLIHKFSLLSHRLPKGGGTTLRMDYTAATCDNSSQDEISP